MIRRNMLFLLRNFAESIVDGGTIGGSLALPAS